MPKPKWGTITVDRERLAEAAACLLRGDDTEAYKILVTMLDAPREPLHGQQQVKR